VVYPLEGIHDTETNRCHPHHHHHSAIATVRNSHQRLRHWRFPHQSVLPSDVNAQVDASGYHAVEKYDGQLKYWCQDWQTDEMTLQKYEVSANERFYKQEYCGCSHSLRDSNEWRKANGIPKIRIGGDTAGLGERYFCDPITDAQEESQDVVDEFFKVANEIAAVTTNTDSTAVGGSCDEVAKKRKAALRAYGERRKNEKDDGIINGLNNW